MAGPIIHNDQVIARLGDQGVKCISDPDQAQPGQTVIIRSHGEGRETFRRLQQRGAEILDATCPNVVRIHQIVADAEQRGRQPVIIGTPTHPEIVAVAGWCDHPVILEDVRQLQAGSRRSRREKQSDHHGLPDHIHPGNLGTVHRKSKKRVYKRGNI